MSRRAQIEGAMPIPIYFRRILTPWIFLSSRYGRLGMGFCTSQKYSSTSRKIDVRTIGFEPASRLDFQIRILRSTISAICERRGTYLYLITLETLSEMKMKYESNVFLDHEPSCVKLLDISEKSIFPSL